METWKGHGRKIQQNLQSTKIVVREEEKETNKCMGDISTLERCHHAVYDLHEDMDRTMYTDQTGKFPVSSYRGMQCIMVLYETDSNAILVEPLCSRTSREIVAAHQKLVKRLKEAGIKVTY